jgi:hypothetical protein
MVSIIVYIAGITVIPRQLVELFLAPMFLKVPQVQLNGMGKYQISLKYSKESGKGAY